MNNELFETGESGNTPSITTLSYLIERIKLFAGGITHWTNPFSGQIVKRCARRNGVHMIPLFRIIHIPAFNTNIAILCWCLFHRSDREVLCLRMMNNNGRSCLFGNHLHILGQRYADCLRFKKGKERLVNIHIRAGRVAETIS